MANTGLQLTLQLVDLKLDDKALERRIKNARRRNLMKAGAFVRTRARSKIGRKAKNTTKPRGAGQPPRHRTEPGLKKILFAYDFDRETVVVGPVLFTNRRTADPGGALQEFGGSTTLTIQRRGGQRRRIRAHYKPRPTMGPALEEETEAGNVLNAWKASL